MNNKSDDNRGGLGKSLLERVKDISQKAGKALAGFVGSSSELEKEARRKAEIRINEIIKRLSSGNLSATEIQELIREGNELIQNFPGLSIATAFSSVASQVGGTSIGISQNQPTVTNNNIEIKDEKTISLSELFNFHPDIIKAEEENKKLKNRFDAIKREPPDEQSLNATREAIDEHKHMGGVHEFITLTGKALHVMSKKIEDWEKKVKTEGDSHQATLDTMKQERDGFRKDAKETIVDMCKTAKVAEEMGVPGHQMNDQQALQVCNNFKSMKLPQEVDDHINKCLDKSEKGLDFGSELAELGISLNIESPASLSTPKPVNNSDLGEGLNTNQAINKQSTNNDLKNNQSNSEQNQDKELNNAQNKNGQNLDNEGKNHNSNSDKWRTKIRQENNNDKSKDPGRG